MKKKLAPAPVVQQVVKVIEKEAKVEVDRAEATEVVKGALGKSREKSCGKDRGRSGSGVTTQPSRLFRLR